MKFKKKKRVEHGRYIFPNILARTMARVSQRTQYEASMMAIVCILIGVFAMTIITVTADLSGWVKFFAVFNAVAAFVLLSSYLVTQFQQYRSYLEMMGIIKDHSQDSQYLKGGSDEEEKFT